MNNALKTYKLQDWVKNYANNMSRNIDWKIDFFIHSINKILDWKKLKILDLGCCSGDLSSKILNYFWENSVHITWVDLSPEMIQIAKNNNKNIDFRIWNAYDLNFKENSFDIIICSSIIHELGSYFGEKNMKDYNKWINLGLKNMHNILNKNWYILIKDPVKPIWENEIIVNYNWKIDNSWNLINFDYKTRADVFIKKFSYFSEEKIITNEKQIITNLANLSEIIHHTSSAICDTIEHFEDELQEWYGSWNIEKWQDFIKNNSSKFKLFSHNTKFSQENHSVEFYKFFEFFHKNNQKIHNPQKFIPTHQFTILQKN